MAKRSQRRPVRSEKEQFGCMGGLISMFDFRPSRTTQRLLSDKRRGNKHAGGAGNQGDKHDTLYPNDTCRGFLDDGEETTMTNSCKPSMKKLIEEEMSTEQDMKIENAEVESKQCDSVHGDNRRKSHGRTKMSRKESYDDLHDVDAAEKVGSEGPCHHKPEHQAICSLDIKNAMEELCGQIHQNSVNCVKHEQPGELHMERDQKSLGFEEKLSQVIKFLVSQKFTEGNAHVEDGELRTSKDLIEALQILSSDEELFLKLLRDPNSLLVRYVQDLPNAEAKKEESESLAECDISKEELANPGQSDELVNRKHRNFFRRKVKSRGRDTSNESKFSQTSNKIVILKPGPAALQNPESGSSLGPSTESHYVIRSNSERNEKVNSHIFLSEIKRKLKHAMGMEQQRTSIGGISKRSSVENQNAGCSGGVKEDAGMNSPTKDHFFIERIARPSMGRLKDCEINIGHETADFSKQKASSIYIEAKKHLSEMLNHGDQNADCSSRQAQKTLGKILSLSDYNSSPVGSPGRNRELSSVTARRLAASDTSQVINENMQHNHVSHLSQTSENSETQPSISGDLKNSEVQNHNLNLSIPDQNCDDNRVDEASCSIGDQMSSRDAVEILKVAETIVEEESNLLDTFPEPSTSYDTRDDKIVDISDACAEKQDPQFSKQTCEVDQLPSSPLVSPPHSSVTMKVKYSDKVADVQERSSPVSVLEPFFIEDVISPASTRSDSAETAIQPLRIQFEEYDSSAANQGNHTKACMDDKESVFEYIKAVLQASALNWDDLYIKSLYSDLLLDPNLIDEVKFYPNQLCHDQKLLFDCVNEVLMEVCGHYFGCSPWVSFVKPSIRPIPNMNNTIQEFFNGVYWHLLPMPLPRTLDQIVRKDMAKTGTWLDLRVDTESIGVEMGEAILEDLLEDIIISCTTSISEPEHSALLA